MKKVFLLLAFVLGISSVNAQISSGEVSSKVIRTGNRAQEGDFGIYFGGTSTIFENLNKTDDFSFKALPLINLKYMKTDEVEARLGIEWWDKTERNSYDGNIIDGNGESRFLFYPGVAYHFSNTNLLDVYAGAELPIGWGTVSKRGSSGGSGDAKKYSASSFNIGLGAFIGLQAYIANLPVAVGVEYGISTINSHVTNTSFEDDGQIINDLSYKDINMGSKDNCNNKWSLGNQFRVTISYYFKSK